MSNTITIEATGPQNACLFFAPLKRAIRGRFDALRATRYDAGAVKLLTEWPQPVPGQRLRLNLDTGEASVIEPLHEAEFAAIRAKIERTGRLEPSAQPTPAHVPTWLYWMKRAVESGMAVVVEGKLPDEIDGEPQLSFFSRPRVSETARLAKAIESQTETLNKLLAELLAGRKR